MQRVFLRAFFSHINNAGVLRGCVYIADRLLCLLLFPLFFFFSFRFFFRPFFLALLVFFCGARVTRNAFRATDARWLVQCALRCFFFFRLDFFFSFSIFSILVEVKKTPPIQINNGKHQPLATVLRPYAVCDTSSAADIARTSGPAGALAAATADRRAIAIVNGAQQAIQLGTETVAVPVVSWLVARVVGLVIAGTVATTAELVSTAAAYAQRLSAVCIDHHRCGHCSCRGGSSKNDKVPLFHALACSQPIVKLMSKFTT